MEPTRSAARVMVSLGRVGLEAGAGKHVAATEPVSGATRASVGNPHRKRRDPRQLTELAHAADQPRQMRVSRAVDQGRVRTRFRPESGDLTKQ